MDNVICWTSDKIIILINIKIVAFSNRYISYVLLLENKIFK